MAWWQGGSLSRLVYSGISLGLAASAGSVRQLVQRLSDPDPEVHVAATTALGRLGDQARPATEVLSRLLSAPDAALRQRAGWALLQIDRGEDYLEPSTLACLDGPSCFIRHEVASNLLHYVPDRVRAAAAIPALIGALRDSEPDVRRGAVETLLSLREATAGEMPRIVQMMHEPEGPASALAAFIVERLLAG